MLLRFERASDTVALQTDDESLKAQLKNVTGKILY